MFGLLRGEGGGGGVGSDFGPSTSCDSGIPVVNKQDNVDQQFFNIMIKI